ncbi:mandelate racemase [Streptosporangium violaceochromogenes]|nr:mandelate racemase [Streptosporangium violaceochromogenes]
MNLLDGSPRAGARIAEARVRILRGQVTDGIAMSFAPLARRTTVLLELRTEDGRVGRGESWANFPSWAPAERLATLQQGVLPLVLGADASEIGEVAGRLIERLEPLARQWGAPGPIWQAISAVDVALWDLRAQEAGLSIAACAGGRLRDEIPVYASSLGPEGAAGQARRAAAAGFRAVKVKLGFGRDRDAANLAEVRTALGPEAEISVDANQAWTVGEATAMAPILAEFGVAWVEEPLRGNDLGDLETLHRRTGWRIATGENLYGRRAFARFTASPAIAVIQPDVTKMGGLSEALEVCRMAEAHDTAVAPHLYGGAAGLLATLQLAAMSPAVTVVEYDVRENPLRDPLIVDPPVPVAGRIAIPDGPGLGRELAPEALEICEEQP